MISVVLIKIVTIRKSGARFGNVRESRVVQVSLSHTMVARETATVSGTEFGIFILKLALIEIEIPLKN